MKGSHATYHANGWKPRTGFTVAEVHEDGTVDLADSNGAVCVTGLAVYSGEGDEPKPAYAVVDSKAAAEKAADEKKPATTPKKK